MMMNHHLRLATKGSAVQKIPPRQSMMFLHLHCDLDLELGCKTTFQQDTLAYDDVPPKFESRRIRSSEDTIRSYIFIIKAMWP